jgi:aminodeoxychorismate lyase
MNTTGFLNFNGKIYTNDKLLISPNNRSFRYGDGCFETMKMLNGKIILEAYHVERLFTSLMTLQFNNPNYFITDVFRSQVDELARKNMHKKAARIRITVARGNGGLYDVENHQPNYVIQTWDLNSANNRFNENGLVMDIYKDARKTYDHFSSIKSNNYLSYAMAALWAKAHQLNDAVLLNPYDRICDATIANVFMVQDGIIKTPAITEGCVGGTMRKYLLEKMKEEGIPVTETQISVEDLLQASEVFLTNSVYGIRWVKSIGDSHYKNQVSAMLFNKFATPLFDIPKKASDPSKSFYLLQLKKSKESSE